MKNTVIVDSRAVSVRPYSYDHSEATLHKFSGFRPRDHILTNWLEILRSIQKRFVKLRAFFEIQAFYMEKYMYIFSEDLEWISVSMICATVVYKQIAPYLWSYKKGEALIGRFQRVAKEQKEKREFQFNLNLPQKKAIQIKLTSAAVLTGALCF